MEFRILGPLEVASGGRELAMPARKQRALVLALLLRPNEIVPSDRLLEALWGDRPPATAATALHGHVSQLRKLLPPDTLLTRPGGYELRLARGQLDLDRFVDLRAEARDALDSGAAVEAGELLDQALALWRGAPLADLADDADAQDELRRLQELRAETLEERVDVELALGRHREVAVELEALVGAQPFRERRRGQLMIALYRSGRQAEALDVYQEGRRRLVDELGIEPGPYLQELQQQILGHDPALRPPTLQTRVARSPSAHEARRAVTVLACGLVLEAADPEALRTLSERALTTVRALVEQHGGVVERELMDLAVATFGAATVHEDAPVRALRAADDIRAALAVRLALASGEAVVSESGTIGEAVSTAQRLQALAEPGELLLDGATVALVRAAVEVEPAGQAFRVIEIDRSAPGVARRPTSALVGREHELDVLEGALERSTVERTPQLVSVVGQAGVGKSRLVAELASRVGESAAILRGRCLSYGDGITYWPIRELVRAAVGAAEQAPAATVAPALSALLGPSEESALAGLLDLFGIGEPAAAETDLPVAVRALLEALARTQPLVVVFDDLEHAEPALLDLIEFVVEWSRDIALTVICIGRPELLQQRPAWAGGRPGTVSISLDGLGARECGVLLENLLGGAMLAPSAAERLIEAAEGNPLFLEQFISMLIDDGLLRLDAGSWVPAGDLTHVTVPPSIQLLLAARLDRLTQDELVVLEGAAVEGVVFHRDAVADALAARPAPSPDVDAALRSLAAKGLVRPTTPAYGGGEAYRFRHLLIRDAAYGALSKEARGQLHEHFARRIEENAQGYLVEVEEILGHHLEQAYRLLAEIGRPDPALAERAAVHLEAAGMRAHGHGDYRSAAVLLGTAADLYAAADSARPQLLPALASALRFSGGLLEARAVVEQGLPVAGTLGDRPVEARLLLEQCSIRLLSDPSVSLDEIGRIADETRRVFAEVGDEGDLARANALQGELSLFACRFGDAEQAYERALAHARAGGDLHVCSVAHGKLAHTAFLGPRPAASGIERCDALQFEPDANPSARAQGLAAAAILEAMAGGFDEGRARIAACRAVGREFGLERTLAWVPGFAGCIELLAGDYERAAAELRIGYDALRSLGETAVLATTAALLAQALERQGDADETRRVMTESEDVIGAADLVSRIYWSQVQTRLHARSGERDEAERVAREAVALTAGTDMLAVQGAVLLDLATVLESGTAERTETLGRALALFEAKGDEVDAARARALQER